MAKLTHKEAPQPWRILCELYAKLIAMMIQHWILVSSCWLNPYRSQFIAVKTVRRHTMNVVSAFACRCQRRIEEAIETMGRSLTVAAKINKRRKQPHTYQLLFSLSRNGV